MARNITDYDGQIINPDSDYPDGDIKDDSSPGADDGTIINRKSNSDIQQFFMKILREAVVITNGLPDNDYNGYQLFEAFRIASLPYQSYMFNIQQAGTFAPSVFQYVVNTTGVISFARTSTGVYTATLTGAFLAPKTYLQISGSNNGLLEVSRTSDNVITIRTYDTTGTLADGIMTNTFLEIRILY